MKNYLTVVFAVTLWQVFILGAALAVVTLGGATIDFDGILSSPALWSCFLTTALLHPLLFLVVERPLFGLAANFARDLKVRYGIAMAVFYLVVGAIFFLPFAAPKFALTILGAVMMISVLSAFFAGWLRGWLVLRISGGGDHWMSGTTA